jgi:thiamine-phosphate pyrophosphorylase
VNSLSAGELRLLDANANRAREGVRTAEDYIRFTCGDHRWAAALKNARRSITDLISQVAPADALLSNRSVITDPLRPESSTPAAPSAESPKLVAQRGLKRAQEALRVLEEYLRAQAPAISQGFEQLRYQLYEAEQWLMLATEKLAILCEATVYVLLTDALCHSGWRKTAEAVLKAGVRALQLREKDMPDRRLVDEARSLRALCDGYKAVSICNDRTDLALAAGAAGVHLGQEDLAPKEARSLCGERLLIGRSTHDLEQFKRAVAEEAADYVAIGSMYPTETKAKHVLAGPGLAREVSRLSVGVPVFAIGGITLERVEELKRAGVRHIALSSAIISSADPYDAACRFLEAMAK